MLSSFQIIGNDYVTVCYNEIIKCVSVEHPKTKDVCLFAGYPLIELFNELKASFSEHITYDDARKHFIPNTTSVNI